MTLPANVNTGYVTGLFMDNGGALMSGTITFTPSPAKILDATSSPPTTILPTGVVVTLSAGTFSQKLIATDDTDLNPTGWTYRVDFALKSGSTQIAIDSFNIAVPTGLVGAAVDLTTLSPVVDPNAGTIYNGGSGLDISAVHAASSKVTLVDNDETVIADSEASYGLKKGLMSAVWAYIQGKMNAAGVAKLSTARNIAGHSFDGTASITITASDVSAQPVDSDLTAIAALSTTSYGRGFLTLANQAATMALLSASSTSAQGIVELATDAEAITGTDTARAVTPHALLASLVAYVNTLVNQPSGSLNVVTYDGSAWPPRPTARTDIHVIYYAPDVSDPSPTDFIAGVDFVWQPTS